MAKFASEAARSREPREAGSEQEQIPAEQEAEGEYCRYGGGQRTQPRAVPRKTGQSAGRNAVAMSAK